MNNKHKINIKTLVTDPVILIVRRIACALPSVKDGGGGVGAWLVGGALRDLVITGRVDRDYDFAVTCECRLLAEAVAKELGASVFPLDRERGLYRVVSKEGLLSGKGEVSRGAVTIDIGPLKDETITADLLKRDFTVDAMAVDIFALGDGEEDGITSEALIDPTGGLADATELKLRPVTETIFDDDPLRCLRAVRLAATMKLDIAPATRELIKEKALLLERVAAERVRDELLIIFASTLALRGVRLLFELDLTGKIFPALFTGSTGSVTGAWSANFALRRLQKAEIFLGEIKDSDGPFRRLYNYLAGGTGPATNLALLRLSVFFSEASKEGVGQDGGRFGNIADTQVTGLSPYEIVVRKDLLRLCLGTGAVSAVLSALKFRHGVFRLMALERITDRSRHRFFDAAGGGTGLLALSLAVACEGSSFIDVDPSFEVFVRTMVDFYFDEYLPEPLPPLLTGSEIMEVFSVKEGSVVGALAGALNFAESEGIVDTRDEALAFLKDYIERSTT